MNKKINKVKSIVAAALLLLLCMCFLCGCNNGTEQIRYEKVNFTILSDEYFDLKNFSSFYNDIFYFNREYDVRCVGSFLNWWDFYTKTDKENGDALLNEKLRTYDDEFFNANDLVMVIYTGNATDNVNLAELTIENNSLIADIEVSIDGGAENDGIESYRVFLIKIPSVVSIRLLRTATKFTVIGSESEVKS